MPADVLEGPDGAFVVDEHDTLPSNRGWEHIAGIFKRT
jgi:hypothetical protein